MLAEMLHLRRAKRHPSPVATRQRVDAAELAGARGIDLRVLAEEHPEDDLDDALVQHQERATGDSDEMIVDGGGDATAKPAAGLTAGESPVAVAAPPPLVLARVRGRDLVCRQA